MCASPPQFPANLSNNARLHFALSSDSQCAIELFKSGMHRVRARGSMMDSVSNSGSTTNLMNPS